MGLVLALCRDMVIVMVGYVTEDNICQWTFCVFSLGSISRGRACSITLYASAMAFCMTIYCGAAELVKSTTFKLKLGAALSKELLYALVPLCS